MTDLYRITVVTELPENVEANNVLYVRTVDAVEPSEADMGAAAAEWVLFLWDNIKGFLPTAVTVARILIYVVDELTGQGTLQQEVPIGLNGTATDFMAPHGVAPKVDIKVAGRPRASSVYVAGWNQDAFDANGLMLSNTVAALLAFGSDLAQFFLATNGVEFDSVYWSQTDLQDFTLNGASVIVNDVPDYQRRRKPGVGS